MKSDKIIIVAEIQKELSRLSIDQLEDVKGFVNHLQNVQDVIQNPKEEAKLQIQQALENGFAF